MFESTTVKQPQTYILHSFAIREAAELSFGISYLTPKEQILKNIKYFINYFSMTFLANTLKSIEEKTK